MFSSASAIATSRPEPPTEWIFAAATGRIGQVLEIVPATVREIVPGIVRETAQAIEVVTVRARGIAPKAEAIAPPRVVPRTPATRRALPRAAEVPRLRTVVVVAAR
jgi:hypothetical protein